MTLSTAVCCQLFRLPCRFTISSLQKKCFHFSSSVNYQPKIQFNVTRKSVSKLRLRDKVPEHYELIYKAPMEATFRVVYPVVLLVTIAAPTYVLYHYLKEEKQELIKEYNNIKFLNPSNELMFFLAMSSVFAVAVFGLIFKFPFRVYKHNTKQEYIAMFLSVVPPMLRKFHFKSAAKTKFKNPFYSMMDGHHYYLDKRRGFLMAHYFRVPADLFEMMGDEKIKYWKQ
uniref:Uncharacterized protein n=1 Tax=Graphocephala atropunctata TaxID=36148 RepID=A0A1B6MNF0_9HEMI